MLPLWSPRTVLVPRRDQPARYVVDFIQRFPYQPYSFLTLIISLHYIDYMFLGFASVSINLYDFSYNPLQVFRLISMISFNPSQVFRLISMISYNPLQVFRLISMIP